MAAVREVVAAYSAIYARNRPVISEEKRMTMMGKELRRFTEDENLVVDSGVDPVATWSIWMFLSKHGSVSSNKGDSFWSTEMLCLERMYVWLCQKIEKCKEAKEEV